MSDLMNVFQSDPTLQESAVLHVLEILVAQTEKQTYPAQTPIFEKGDAADAYFIIKSGRVEINDAGVIIGELTNGEGFGEMALLSGQPRSASVITKTETTVAEIPRERFVAAVEDHPEIGNHLYNVMRRFIRQSLLAKTLQHLMGDFDADLLLEIEDDLIWRTYNAGEVLLAQGDEGQELIIIISGRVRVMHHDGVHERLLGEVGDHNFIGELALFGDATRSATVTAMRETTTVALARPMFEAIMTRFPAFTHQLMQTIVTRQRQSYQQAYFQKPNRLNLSLVATHEDIDLQAFAAQLLPYLQQHGKTIIMDQAAFNAWWNVTDASQRVPPLLMQQWMQEIEQAHDYVVYLADQAGTTWTDAVVRHADRVLLVAEPHRDPRPAALEREIMEKAYEQRFELVMLHPEATTQPEGTAQWLDPRPVQRHYHVRQGDGAHFARLARLLTGNGIGLVLAGGGARGYAHLGVLRALMEAQVPIDAIGSVSMGAIIGGGLLEALSRDDIYNTMMHKTHTYGARKMILDSTLPMSALMQSKRITESLQKICGDLDIEDGWLPFYCVSTNLTRAELHVHWRGKLHRAARASMSIPGVFSPVVRDEDLMVDGGTMNNFPVDIMREFLNGGTVIGTLMNSKSKYRVYEIDDYIDGTRIFLSRFLPWMKKQRVPSIVKTILNASSVSSLSRLDEYRNRTDFLLETDTSPYGILDFDNHVELAKLGYDQQREKIKAWATENQALIQQPAPWHFQG